MKGPTKHCFEELQLTWSLIFTGGCKQWAKYGTFSDSKSEILHSVFLKSQIQAFTHIVCFFWLTQFQLKISNMTNNMLNSTSPIRSVKIMIWHWGRRVEERMVGDHHNTTLFTVFSHCVIMTIIFAADEIMAHSTSSGASAKGKRQHGTFKMHKQIF